MNHNVSRRIALRENGPCGVGVVLVEGERVEIWAAEGRTISEVEVDYGKAFVNPTDNPELHTVTLPVMRLRFRGDDGHRYMMTFTVTSEPKQPAPTQPRPELPPLGPDTCPGCRGRGAVSLDALAFGEHCPHCGGSGKRRE